MATAIILTCLAVSCLADRVLYTTELAGRCETHPGVASHWEPTSVTILMLLPSPLCVQQHPGLLEGVTPSVSSAGGWLWGLRCISVRLCAIYGISVWSLSGCRCLCLIAGLWGLCLRVGLVMHSMTKPARSCCKTGCVRMYKAHSAQRFFCVCDN